MKKTKNFILIIALFFVTILISACVLNPEKISQKNEDDINQIESLNVYKNYKDGSPRRAYDKSDDTLIATYDNVSDKELIEKIYNIIMEESGPFFSEDCDCMMLPYFRLEFIKDNEIIDVYLDQHYFIARQGEKEIKRGTYYEKSEQGDINEVFETLKLKVY